LKTKVDVFIIKNNLKYFVSEFFDKEERKYFQYNGSQKESKESGEEADQESEETCQERKEKIVLSLLSTEQNSSKGEFCFGNSSYTRLWQNIEKSNIHLLTELSVVIPLKKGEEWVGSHSTTRVLHFLIASLKKISRVKPIEDF
jgi:hypothetical protein